MFYMKLHENCLSSVAVACFGAFGFVLSDAIILQIADKISGKFY